MKNKEFLKASFEYELKAIKDLVDTQLDYFLKNPCTICGLSIGRYNCISRKRCKSNDGYIWRTIKKHLKNKSK